ncbi:MAG: amino acid adenylation domain-containing protein, partial [Symploca sp. SIO2G7]|nr:amino acid adenylation domain-containing protein [Symploca sp. SIO2G7]
NAPMPPLELPTATLTPLTSKTVGAKFDLTLLIQETETGLMGGWEYNTDLFDAETIARLTAHFENLLTAIGTNPERKLSELSLMSQAERKRLLIEWNNTATDYPKDKCIHQLFEEQVERTPNSVAVVLGNRQLTYQQLNERANQLAHYLQTLEVAPEVIVGICVERSIEMIVGLLGILKAGGAYLPLDPSYPQERLLYMLEDAGVSVLLTQESLRESTAQYQSRVVCLDADWERLEPESKENFDSGVKPDNLAYVIYTSGSTGKPKGVLVAHQGLCNLSTMQIQSFNVQPDSRVFQFASFSFDVSISEIFMALGSGARLCLGTPASLLVGSDLMQLLQTQAITHVSLIPSVLATLSPEELANVGTIIVAGEACSSDLVRKWSKGRRFFNAYGPTESTVYTTLAEYTDGIQKLSIGKPIANTQVYILDEHLQPVPVGVPGELYIGGAGLARGYLNRPQLTTEKFIPNPFYLGIGNGQQATGNRQQATGNFSLIYKTGDLARYLPDGNIEFIGRIDNQVKIRGFRIELGEIESVLVTYPQIQQTVVIAREDIPGNKTLVVYLVAENPSISQKELRNFLKQKLPEYMVPGVFVMLEALPLTLNGKIDRRALPAPDRSQHQLSEFVPPRTPTEEAIANIFISVLKLKRVGINDNFFELGGHSLLATQVISQLQETFNVGFPLRYLLESPTVAELSQSLLEYCQVESAPLFVPLPTIVPAPEQRHQPFSLTDIQQAYWLGRNQAFELGNIAAHSYVELESNHLNLERLNLAWQKLIDRHDMLKTVILPDGQQQILETVPNYEIEVLDLCGQPPEVVNARLESIRDRMSHEVLSAERWPLFEIRATCLEEQRIRLHLSFDALIADAWSLFVIGREWTKLYDNPDWRLPPLEISFRDYVLADTTLEDTPQYQRSREYWFNRLDTLPPGPEFPLAKNPALITQPQFKRRSAELSPAQWQQLKDRANQFNLTPSGLLLTAFAQILGSWSKSQKFTINLTRFNRLSLHPQVNNLVGDFTSLTLLEIDNSVPDTFANRAQQLQQQLWQDLDHGYFNAVRVQRELNRRRESYQTVPVVFTSTLGLESLNENGWTLDSLGEQIYGITQTPQVWLDHQVGEKNGTLVFNWDAVEELFPKNLLDDMWVAYCRLLDSLTTSDSAWVEMTRQLLPLAQLQERNDVNQTTAPVSQQTLHGLFINQVNVQPQSLAIITPECQLTYQELYQRANQLAHQLRQLGATPNSLVAVVMEKGWEQIVVVLGILISGAAYLPIDPSQPQERQWYLLQQGEVKLVVTQPQLASSLSLPSEVQALSVDEQVEMFSKESLRYGTNCDLAYVIYTSGSTGLPKGVMIDHRGAVNTILDINQRFGVGTSDRVLALSALNFDLSVYDIFGILAAGGTIVIPAKEGSKDPAHWLELIEDKQVTLWNSVPALMQMLVEYLSAQPEKAPKFLRLALLSGDWLPKSLPGQIQALCSNIEIVSLGGATEASIWSICYPIETVDPNWKSIPYGQPLKNQRFYVFNELMEPTPVWVPGQLYIGGIGLFKGYWRDEEKTKASLIYHPVTGERLYKTGDLGRYLPDGNIEFLGREDFQVKINGYRIELGEIEATLEQHPAIKDVVVTGVQELENQQQLVAYVVLNQDLAQTKQWLSHQTTQSSPSILTQLREYLQQKLPRYMLPSVFMVLESLPLTPNGKVDRQALPAPERTPELAKTFVAPRNPVEELLVTIWTEVFHCELISIHEDFFELGGNSFLALQLISKINQKLDINISLGMLFQYPTIAEIANFILKTTNASVKPTYLVPIQVTGTQPPLFCIHPIGGQVMVYQHLAACLGLDRPMFALQSRAINDPVQEHSSINQMAVEYAKAIRQHQPHSPYYLMGWSMGGVIAVSVAKELEKQGQNVAFVGLVDAFLIPENTPTLEGDPFGEVASVFGGTFVDALMNLETSKQQLLREELINLPSFKRLQRMVNWGQDRNLLSTDITAELLQKQVNLIEIHEKLLRVHRAPQIQANLHIWWASDQPEARLSPTNWSQYTTSASYTETVQGNHFTLMRPPYVKCLAEKLRDSL